MAAIGRAVKAGRLHAEIAGVVTNQPAAAGLTIAESEGWPAICVDHREYPSREAFDTALAQQVTGFSPDLVVLAGFMRLLTPVFVDQFAGRLINIHPSLLPKYPGLHTHARAIEAGDTTAGATVHFVINELDAGPGIIQGAVPIEVGDTPEALAEKVLCIEHELFVTAIDWLLCGRVCQQGHVATLDGEKLPPGGAQWVA